MARKENNAKVMLHPLYTSCANDCDNNSVNVQDLIVTYCGALFFTSILPEVDQRKLGERLWKKTVERVD